MSNIQRQLNKDIVHNFRWKTAKHNGDEYFYPEEMKTKHLFYTWLMIWNHAAPKSMRIWDNHRYVFDEFYTPEYMLQAFKVLYLELKTREDLGSKMRGVVDRIQSLYRETFYKSAELPVKRDHNTRMNSD